MESVSAAALILIPTPIGNLEDLSPRARQAIEQVDVLLAEDTRHTGQMLKRMGISARLHAFHAHNEHRMLELVLNWLGSGMRVGMVTDAGTPGISDPAFLLSRACREKNIAVSCLPGPTALIPALVMSGLPCDKFFFEGFLPHKKGRQSRWAVLSKIPVTLVLFESPHRIVRTLKEAASQLGEEREASVVREISKWHESVHHGTLGTLVSEAEIGQWKGEMVLVIGPEAKAPSSKLVE